MIMKKKLTVTAIVFAMCLSIGLLGACAQQSQNAGSNEAEGDAVEQTEAAEGTEAAGEDAAADTEAAGEAVALTADSSLLASYHPEGTLTTENVTHQSTCIACHNREGLVESGEGVLFDPNSNLSSNPHANHQFLTCTDCHATEGPSVLYCNSCHEFDLPEGWENPEMTGSELAYSFDVGGMGLDWESTDRDKTVLTDDQIAPYSVADDAEGVDQNQGYFAK